MSLSPAYCMKKRQYVFVNSVRTVVGVLAENAAKFASQSGFVAVWNRVQALADQIETLTVEQERDRTGVTAEKNRAREELIGACVVVGGMLSGFARQTDRAEVHARATASRTAWRQVPQGKLADAAEAMLELARQHRELLRSYGLTDDVFERFEEAIRRFRPMAGSPRGELIRRATSTKALEEKIGQLADLLDHSLDPLMNQFRESEPAFFSNYQQARKRVHLPATPIEIIRERAAVSAAKAKASKAARAERVAAKAAAEAAAKAQRRSRLEAIARGALDGASAGGNNGNGITRMDTPVAAPATAALPN